MLAAIKTTILSRRSCALTGSAITSRRRRSRTRGPPSAPRIVWGPQVRPYAGEAPARHPCKAAQFMARHGVAVHDAALAEPRTRRADIGRPAFVRAKMTRPRQIGKRRTRQPSRAGRDRPGGPLRFLLAHDPTGRSPNAKPGVAAPAGSLGVACPAIDRGRIANAAYAPQARYRRRRSTART